MTPVLSRRKALSWIQQYRSVLLLLAAIAVGALAAIGARSYIAEQVALERERLQPRREEVDVVVAKRDLQRGDLVGPETMAVRRMPAEYASASIVRPDRIDAYFGARLNMSLRSGEPLIAQGVEGLESSAFSTKVRNGIRALTIAVDEVNSISGMLQPGDRIDLQLSARPASRSGLSASPNELTKVLMQDLLVLATGRQVRQVGEEGVRTRTFTAITVEVNPDQAQRLVVAQRGGRLTATLRNRDDRVVVDQKAIDINDLLGLPSEAAPRRATPLTELIVGGQGPLRPVQLNPAGNPNVSGDMAAAAGALLQRLGSAANGINADPTMAGLGGAPKPAKGSRAPSTGVGDGASSLAPTSAPSMASRLPAQ